MKRKIKELWDDFFYACDYIIIPVVFIAVLIFFAPMVVIVVRWWFALWGVINA